MFVVELVEVKAHPCQAGPLEFGEIGGDTVGFLLHITKSYFSTGRYVIINYSFYVLKVLIQLSKKGVFACYVIKKRRYFPSMVPCKDMGDHFGEVEVGEKDVI